MNCIKDKKIIVLSSYNRYYIGTVTDYNFPYCRISSEYYKTKELAQTALNNNTFTLRKCVENEYCSNNKSCIKEN